jgi:formylglycine-generating enzyme required for sulfatase activity
VEIPHDFYLGVYEVTQGEWQTVTGTNPIWFSRKGSNKDAVKDIPDEELKRFPVETVSWIDAQMFLETLNAREKETGWMFRLPKEAEWEYACRGGPRADKFEYGFDFYCEKPTNQLLLELAFFAPKKGEGLQRPCKVGSYKPNSLGLYDMHGNVREWCDDEEHTPEKASHRVLRGGSWSAIADRCRAGFRGVYAPSFRDGSLGLRLARVSVSSGDKNDAEKARRDGR